MPVSMLHARTDPGQEALWRGRCPRSEAMPGLVAVMARGDHIGPVSPAVLLGYKVFGGGLQPTSLAQGQPVRYGKAGAIGEPHGEVAVKAPARLAVEGGITGGTGGVCHDESREAGGFPPPRCEDERAPGPMRYSGTTPGAQPARQCSYRAV